MNIPEDILTLVIVGKQRPLTSEEELTLQDWLQGDTGREMEVQKLISSLQEYQLAECLRHVDVESGWAKVDGQTSGAAGWRKKRQISYWCKIAALLIPFVIAGTLAWWLNSGKERTVEISEFVDIRPGSEQAELILADGQKITLKNQKQKEITSRDGKVIGLDSANTLTYASGESRIQDWNILRIPKGGEYQLILSDGTRVWLNSDSELKFPVRFNQGERRVKLKGEAFFEVAKDVVHPFLVETEYSEIRVLGTAFNVSGYEGDAFQQTTLVEGSVEVILPERTCLLEPGKQLELNLQDRSVAIKHVDVSLYTSWKDGLFRFCDMPLEELVVKLERWYNVSFFFIQEECREVRFTGAIRKYSDFHEFIRLIETTTDVKFNVKESTVTIQKK